MIHQFTVSRLRSCDNCGNTITEQDQILCEECRRPKNCYKFNVTYGEQTIMRTINATTYSAALNLLYFPPNEKDTQADACHLIGLKHKGVWKGDNVLSNPSVCDFPKGNQS